MAIYNGTAAGDNISGTGNNDTIKGSGGNDTLLGQGGNDVIDGGAGTDTARYRGNFADYTITWDSAQRAYRIVDKTGRDGSDIVSNVEFFRFADGTWSYADLVAGSGDGVVLSGTDGADQLTGGIGYDMLQGGAGDDVLEGRGHDDRIEGGTGTDTARFSGAFADYTITWDAETRKYTIVDRVAGRDGSDQVSGVEYFQFSDGTRSIADLPTGQFGLGDGMFIAGTSGNDVLTGNVGYDQIDGGAGNDQIDGGGATDFVHGGAGDDRILASAGDDSLHGDDGYGDVLVLRGNRSEYDIRWNGDYRGYEIRDLVAGRDGTDFANGFEFFQFADGTLGIEQLVSGVGDGVELHAGMFGQNVAVGGPGYDTLEGTQGDDQLDGGAAGDILLGAGGNDLLIGGAGDDRLDGGAGVDRAVFSGNRAQYEVVRDEQTGEFTVRDLVAGRDGTDRVFGVEALAFADGSLVYGTDGNDQLGGTAGSDVLQGGAGDDTLFASPGMDALLGGDGQDTAVIDGYSWDYFISWMPEYGQYSIMSRALSNPDGEALQDIEYVQFLDGVFDWSNLVPGMGDGVTVTGTSLDDGLRGSAGYDTLDGLGGNDTLDGGDAADVLHGGTGDDRLRGGRGDDSIDGGEGRDVAEFGGARADYLVTWNATTRQYTIENTSFWGMDGKDVVRGVEFFQFADGMRSIADLVAGQGDGVAIQGTAGDDVLLGDVGYDTLGGGAGNDVLRGGDAADMLYGSAGDDRLHGGSGDDRIDGGAGRDVAEFSGARADYLVTWDATARQYTIQNTSPWGTDGTDVVSGVEFFQFADGMHSIADLVPGEGDGIVLFATAGGDSLVGDVGYDVLNGAEGNDWLDGGDGGDILFGYFGDDRLRGGGGNDTLNGHYGRDTAVFSGSRADYAISWDSAAWQYTITDISPWGNDGTDLVRSVEFFQFADGLYSIADLLPDVGDGDRWPGTAGDDFMQGYVGFDEFWGEAGNDWLDGGDANDTLHGGAGDDQLRGGRGNDLLDGGQGRDVAQFSGSRADYLVTWDAVARRYTIENTSPWGTDGTDVVSGVEYFQFADGMYDIRNLVPGGGDGEILTGTDGNDFLQGGLGYDSLQGGAGNDILDGQEANDALAGGDGDDDIMGGTGNDFLDGGAGDDDLWGDGGSDTIVGGAGIDTAHFDGYSWDYAVTWDAGTRQYTLSNYWNTMGSTDVVSGVEYFQFYDGMRDIGNLVYGAGDGESLTGTDGMDFLEGGVGYDSLQGGAGNDYLDGRGANDVLAGGDGDDGLMGGAGDDALDGGAGDDHLSGGSGRNTIVGGAGIDTAHFDGYSWDYAVTWDAGTRQYTLSNYWNTMGSTDVVSGVEYFQFYDGMRDIGNLVYGAGDGQILPGTDGDDFLEGGVGYDTLQGGAGNDYLEGKGANDVLAGGDGNDGLVGDAGNDTLDGGAGDDFLYGGGGGDTIEGGAGTDIAIFDGYSWEYSATWNAETRQYSIWHNYSTFEGTDLVSGVETFRFYDGDRTGNDLVPGSDPRPLVGTEWDDWLAGTAGNDTILGLSGNDMLLAMEGNDVLDGGPGKDTLDGGAGADTYVLHGDDVDWIASFVAGEDRIELSGALFDGMPKGALNDLSFQAGPSGSGMGISTRVALDTNSGAVYFDPDGPEGAMPAGQISLVDLNGLQGTLTAADFWIV